MNREKLMKMAGAVRTGGKGSVRRKKKAIHKTMTTDDKRLQSTLKRLGVNAIPAIEEVNIFKDDMVIQFQNPKVQASIVANTWVVSGTPQTKKLQDLLPGIINQLGPDNLDNLRRLAEQFQKQVPGAAAAAAQDGDDDDEVPDLVPGETFEAAANDDSPDLLKRINHLLLLQMMRKLHRGTFKQFISCGMFSNITEWQYTSIVSLMYFVFYYCVVTIRNGCYCFTNSLHMVYLCILTWLVRMRQGLYWSIMKS